LLHRIAFYPLDQFLSLNLKLFLRARGSYFPEQPLDNF
jgi:hypothetical protein